MKFESQKPNNVKKIEYSPLPSEIEEVYEKAKKSGESPGLAVKAYLAQFEKANKKVREEEEAKQASEAAREYLKKLALERSKSGGP